MKNPAGQMSPRQIPQYVAAFIVNLNALSYGYAVGWSANALAQLQKPDSALSLTADEASWVASILVLGGLITIPFLSFLPNRIGCKKTGYLTGLVMVASWLVTIFSQTAIQLYVGRFLTGVGGGLCYILSPVYVVQFADINIRGSLGSLVTLEYSVGIALVYIIGGSLSYETTLYIGLAIPLMYLAFFIGLPEAPKYLIKNGNIVQAEKSLKWFRGKDYDVSIEIESIKESMNSTRPDSSETFSIKLLTSKSVLRGHLILVVLTLNYHLSGVVPVITYTNLIFEESGSLIPPQYSTITIGICQIIGNVLSMFFVDRYGRKMLLIISDAVTALMLLLMGAYFYLKRIGVDVSSVEWLPVLCLSIYIIFIAIGLGPLLYVILAEIVPTSVLWLAQQLAYCILWLIAFLLTKYFYIIIECIDMHGSFWIFSASCIISIAIIAVLLPETKGKTLDQIQLELKGKRSVLDTEIVRIV